MRSCIITDDEARKLDVEKVRENMIEVGFRWKLEWNKPISWNSETYTNQRTGATCEVPHTNSDKTFGMIIKCVISVADATNRCPRDVYRELMGEK